MGVPNDAKPPEEVEGRLTEIRPAPEDGNKLVGWLDITSRGSNWVELGPRSVVLLAAVAMEHHDEAARLDLAQRARAAWEYAREARGTRHEAAACAIAEAAFRDLLLQLHLPYSEYHGRFIVEPAAAPGRRRKVTWFHPDVVPASWAACAATAFGVHMDFDGVLNPCQGCLETGELHGFGIGMLDDMVLAQAQFTDAHGKTWPVWLQVDVLETLLDRWLVASFAGAAPAELRRLLTTWQELLHTRHRSQDEGSHAQWLSLAYPLAFALYRHLLQPQDRMHCEAEIAVIHRPVREPVRMVSIITPLRPLVPAGTTKN